MLLKRWDDSWSSVETLKFLSDLAHMYAGRSPSAPMDVLIGLIEKSDWEGVLSVEPDYTLDWNLPCLMDYRQVLGLFQKLDCLPTSFGKHQIAWEKFLETERHCRRTNELFSNLPSTWHTNHLDVHAVLHGAAVKIAKVLGDAPSVDDLKVRYGPGATTRITKRDACIGAKLSAPPSCSEGFFESSFSDELLSSMPGYVQHHGVVVDDESNYDVPILIESGRLSFVAKNAKTDRSIVVEPQLNSMLQLAIGDLITSRLKRFGIDLTDQSINRGLARDGSLTGALATLDLSSASDLVSRELVYHLLPIDWALLMDSCRSESVTYLGHKIRLEKFSSMGNGYTFALESLIFWAICKSVHHGCFVSVYGDDLVVEARYATATREALEAVGFIVNEQKSFWTGPFRESCGGDYYRGIDIRPIYIKSKISAPDLFRLYNRGVRCFDQDLCDLVLPYISDELRLYGPDGYGDGHLIGGRPKPHKRECGWAGYTFDTWTFSARKRFRALPGDCLLPAYSIYVGKSDVSRWPDPLPGKGKYRRMSIYTLTPY